MAIVRWMWIQPAASGDPADTRVNTFHFSVPSFDTTIGDAIADAIEAAWNTASDVFGSQGAWGSYHHKAYDLADPEPRAPIYMADATGLGAAPTGDSLPPEICLTLSFQGAQVSGEPQARRRGRIYVGPISEGDSNNGVPSASQAGLVRGIGDDLLAASDAAAGAWRWVVYSPTNDNSVNVVDGWVDNAYDVQRRRGFTATTRYLFPV